VTNRHVACFEGPPMKTKTNVQAGMGINRIVVTDGKINA
jgi:hypothetical protein